MRVCVCVRAHMRAHKEGLHFNVYMEVHVMYFIFGIRLFVSFSFISILVCVCLCACIRGIFLLGLTFAYVIRCKMQKHIHIAYFSTRLNGLPFFFFSEQSVPENRMLVIGYPFLCISHTHTKSVVYCQKK